MFLKNIKQVLILIRTFWKSPETALKFIKQAVIFFIIHNALSLFYDFALDNAGQKNFVAFAKVIGSHWNTNLVTFFMEALMFLNAERF